MGLNFLSFLLDNIEYPPDTDIDDQIPDLFLNCVLSYNLQFQEAGENLVLDALDQRDVAKTFTEKILLLLNRERKYPYFIVNYYIIVAMSTLNTNQSNCFEGNFFFKSVVNSLPLF